MEKMSERCLQQRRYEMEIVGILLTIYILVINIIGFIVCKIDKTRAKRKEWRISEKMFFIIAALGGAIGVYSGMYFFRHKTKHWYFVVGIPVIFIAEIILAIILRKYILF